jgi:hypothetical protein
MKELNISAYELFSVKLTDDYFKNIILLFYRSYDNNEMNI